jgi:hypothetical protein
MGIEIRRERQLITWIHSGMGACPTALQRLPPDIDNFTA